MTTFSTVTHRQVTALIIPLITSYKINNKRILHSLKFSNSNLLLFLEALHIKFKKTELNSGLKASKELVVFP